VVGRGDHRTLGQTKGDLFYVLLVLACLLPTPRRGI